MKIQKKIDFGDRKDVIFLVFRKIPKVLRPYENT